MVYKFFNIKLRGPESFNSNWKEPKSLNGILRSYELTYDNRLSINNTSLRIDELDPYQFYEFSLCACTIQCGLCISKIIQTGQQKDSIITIWFIFK